VKKFPDTPPYEGAFPDPVPHLTVAKSPNPAGVEQMKASIAASISNQLPLHAAVKEISILVENRDGIWSVHYQHALDA
jgi:hypothetical protein